MHKVEPKAILVPNTASPTLLCYLAARRCYSSEENMVAFLDDPSSELPSKDTMDILLSRCIKSGHESVLEHAYFTFHITCSRACSHQIVRHRLANFSQQSQRYVTYSDIGFVASPKLNERYQNLFMQDVEDMYSRAIVDGTPAEDARAYLPNCTATHLFMTMNARELRHFFNERCCYKAQEEIRILANSMLQQCMKVASSLFKGTGPKCKVLGRCPEATPCIYRPFKEPSHG